MTEEIKREDTIKQVIVMRKDLNMRRGKEIAQGSHASMAFLIKYIKQEAGSGLIYSYDMTEAEVLWLEGNHRKITLQVNSEEELLVIYKRAQESNLEVHLITDAGLTEFNGVPTNTCIAIGPDYSSKIDPITKHLKLY